MDIAGDVEHRGQGLRGDSNVRSIHQITVAHQLGLEGKLEACGGAAYLSHLIANCPTTVFAEDYARIVHDLAIKRGLIGAARQIEEIGYSGEQGGKAIQQAGGILGRLAKKPKEPPRRDKPGIGF